jgi:signal transduction histidine kinase
MTTLRRRLTALYGALFFAAGVTMLTIVYVVLSRRIPRVPRIPVGRIAVRREVRQLLLAELTNQRDRALHELLIGSLIALAIVTVVAGALGWAVAGRALRPVRDITATAQRLSTHNLDERINLDGPPDELKELADTFDAMLDRLSSAFESQRQFVANASHELRTPLTVQRAAIDVALDDPEPTVDKLRTMALRLRDATDRNEHLIESLLTLARSQAGVERFDEVDLADVARTTLAAAPARGVTVQPQLHNAPTRGDRALLERLAANLTDNALRHNVPGGWVRVETAADGHTAMLRVSNSSPPVPTELVEQLFVPFRRFDADRTGHGLGLSIVAAVVTAHHGRRFARALPDGGLEITVVLPR